MALRVLHKVVFTVMLDEMTDVSNKEKVIIVLRLVDGSFTVHEDSISLYAVETIQGSTQFRILMDVLLRLTLSVNRVRSQCYDGG